MAARKKATKRDALVYADQDYEKDYEGVVVYDARDEKDAIAKYLRKKRGQEIKPEPGELFSVKWFEPATEPFWLKIKSARRSVSFEIEAD